MTQIHLYEVTFWVMSMPPDRLMSVRAYTAADAVFQTELQLKLTCGEGNYMIREVRPQE